MMTTQKNQQTMPLNFPKKRVTMIKHVVGKVRATSYCLPEGPFGIVTTMDEEDAGKVVQTWAQSEPSKRKTSMRIFFPATNREALRQGCLSARSQREFAKHNPVMKNSPKTTKILPSTSDCAVPTEHAFGIRSEANDVPMAELLRCSALDFEETDYPDRSHMQKKGRLPPAKSTKASRLKEIISPSEEEIAAKRAKENFKLKKFMKVESKVKAMINKGKSGSKELCPKC